MIDVQRGVRSMPAEIELDSEPFARGIELNDFQTQYYQCAARGGLEQAFQYGGRNDYFLNLDAEKLGLRQGASLPLHGEARFGESVNTIASSLLAPDLSASVPLPTGPVSALTDVTFEQSLSRAAARVRRQTQHARRLRTTADRRR